MDLQNLKIFIQVAELKSFTKAGHKLGYSQPTISFQIKQLEEQMNTKLFDRVGHTVTLTEHGREALRYAQAICHMSEEMMQSAANAQEIKGVVKIAIPDSMCTPFIVSRFIKFREKYPHVSLHVINAGTDTMFDLLDHNQVDLICTLDSPIYDSNYIVAHEEKLETNFIVSTDNPITQKKNITIHDLLDQPFILTEKGMSYRRMLEEKLAKNGFEINPVLEIGRTDLICDMISLNSGISFLPDFVTENAVNTGTIKRLIIKDYKIDIWKQLIFRKDKWLSQPMKAIIDFLSVNITGQ